MPFAVATKLAGAASKAQKAKAFQNLQKITSKQWNNMGKAFGEMNKFAKTGGVARFIGGTISTIKTKIENQVIGMFSPVINEITQFTADLVEEAEPLADAIADIIGFLKSISIDIGDINISLLDVALGFPLITNILTIAFEGFQLEWERIVDWWASLWGGQPFPNAPPSTLEDLVFTPTIDSPQSVAPGGSGPGYTPYGPPPDISFNDF